ncbi:nuclear transport factor 2 [Tanacetum coccineum]|uniref:Nuclear transport factor 2 n=1 Tax=Tanacetum coccineum TaxID=301880 RepID=A0ABQ4WKB6_9ASTR
MGNLVHHHLVLVSNPSLHLKILDGHRYAFMEFNNQNAAKLAIEAAFIQFDGWECTVEYKKGDMQGQEGRGTGSVGDNKSGDNNGNGNGSNPVV